MNAGTPVESIHILINAARGIPTPPEDHESLFDSASDYEEVKPRYLDRAAKQPWDNPIPKEYMCHKTWHPKDPEPLTPTTTTDDTDSEDEFVEIPSDVSTEHFTTCRSDRSVVLKGLSKHTSLAEILKMVRGGSVLNAFTRQYDQTAHIAFVEPESAERFVLHVKKHDLYIKNKRIEVTWDNRQHYLTGGIARRIFTDNASRNLVIRFPKPEITEQLIRDDLDHVHLLEVVSVQFRDGHAWISLNGISLAITARSCMMHRLRYKGSRIEFWPDDCAEPLPPVNKKSLPLPSPKKHKSKASLSSVNRFNVLLDEN